MSELSVAQRKHWERRLDDAERAVTMARLALNLETTPIERIARTELLVETPPPEHILHTL